MSISNWVCDHCYSLMDKTRAGRNRHKVECPECGTYWYIDNDGEMINDGSAWSPFDDCDDEDDEDDDDCERLSVDEAAAIWASHGKDEDYMFGYSEDELEDAL